MKLAILAVALFVVVAADVSLLGSAPDQYLPPGETGVDAPPSDYIPPEGEIIIEGPEDGTPVDGSGYKYKAVKRIRFRHRF